VDIPPVPTDELKSYRDAVWAYLLEHSDITENGAIFIKFHTKNRADFEKHIKGRWIHGYHRIDGRTGETYQQKEERATRQQEHAQGMKVLKKNRWNATREERRDVFARLKKENERRVWLAKHPFIHRLLRATACIGVSLRHYYGKVQSRQKEGD